MKYTKNTTLGEVINSNKDAEKILQGFDLHCFSCPFAQQETLEEASQTHGVDLALLLDKLNKTN